MKTRPITPREAEWLRCIVETFTTTQEHKSDERIRQSVMWKLAEIARSKP